MSIVPDFSQSHNSNSFLVSVHVPKCAGTSLRHWLATAYGAPRIYLDNKDLPLDPSSPMNIDPEGFLSKSHAANQELTGKCAVHGHFWARKYDFLTDAIRITFLREPVERALSHYFYWMQQPRSSNRLHNYVQDNQLSWLEFIRLPAIRSMYSSIFFRDFDMQRFAFIGDSSRLASEMERLGKLLGFTHQIAHENATGGDYQTKTGEILSEPKNVQTLRSLLASDIAFYERHAGR